MRKSLILYDLDGTLVDTKEDIASSANHMLGRMGLPPLTVEQVVPFVGKGISQLIAACLGTDDPRLMEEGLRIYRAHYAEHMLDKSRLYPGALDLLEHFKSRVQAVITNKPNPYSTEILKGLGVARYFIEIVGGDSPYPKKPEPDSLLALMKKAGAGPDETLFIGDSVVDIQTGRRAGVLTAVVTHGFERKEVLLGESPALAVESLKALLEEAKGRGW